MKIAFFSAHSFEKETFNSFRGNHELTFIPESLGPETAVLARGHDAVCAFVNDDLSRPVLEALMSQGVSVVGMRGAGMDNVDQSMMDMLGMSLLVAGYSPCSVAEQAATLLLGLVRHLPEAQRRVRSGDFSIDGLVGSELNGKTVGVIGTGRIGKAFARIMRGFGCKVVAYDISPDQRLPVTEVRYMALDELLPTSDIISLHCPLNQNTEYLIDEKSLTVMKPSAILVNSGWGRLVNTEAVLVALDQNRLAGYAADVYERERGYFHYDFSKKGVADELLNRLRHHPKVMLTAHQGFLTKEALRQTAQSLLNQFAYYENQRTVGNFKNPVLHP